MLEPAIAVAKTSTNATNPIDDLDFVIKQLIQKNNVTIYTTIIKSKTLHFIWRFMIYFVKNPAIIMVSFLPYIFVEYNRSNSTWWVQYNIFFFLIMQKSKATGMYIINSIFILLNYPLPLPLTIHRLFLSTVPPYAESNLPRFQVYIRT